MKKADKQFRSERLRNTPQLQRDEQIVAALETMRDAYAWYRTYGKTGAATSATRRTNQRRATKLRQGIIALKQLSKQMNKQAKHSFDNLPKAQGFDSVPPAE